mgnify:CR=1 FL=1
MIEVEEETKKNTSPSGNRTPVSRVTGGDTYHYTNEDWLMEEEQFFEIQANLFTSADVHMSKYNSRKS